jgi:hypothetical protein
MNTLKRNYKVVRYHGRESLYTHFVFELMTGTKSGGALTNERQLQLPPPRWDVLVVMESVEGEMDLE